MFEIEKENKILILCSIVSLAVAFGGIDIEKINLGFITIKSLGVIVKFGLVLFLVYLLWGFYQKWEKHVYEHCEKDLEDYLCTFLTNVLITKIKTQGPDFCNTNQTFTTLNDWSIISAKSSHFIYSPSCGKKSNNRNLRVQLQKTDEYNNTSSIDHVVHGFYGEKLSELKATYWMKWLVVHPFFRINILPGIVGSIALLVMIVHLIVG
jgi:hypothetical protein